MARSVRRGFFETGDTRLIIDGVNTCTGVNIGERLRNIRKDNNYTQEQLGTILGITRSAVNGWEMGLTTPSIQYLMQLAMLYKVTTDFILGLDNSEFIDISNLKQSDKEIIYSIVNRFDK